MTYVPSDTTADTAWIIVSSDDPDEPQVAAEQIGNARAFSGFSVGWYIVDDSTVYDTTYNTAYQDDYHGDPDSYYGEPYVGAGLHPEVPAQQQASGGSDPVVSAACAKLTRNRNKDRSNRARASIPYPRCHASSDVECAGL